MANPINTNDQNVAIEGYDPISYFGDRPVKGNPSIITTHNGVIYHFSTSENKAQFENNPDQYLPQYGGFCAVAVSEGKLVPVDPETYKVTDGKLYLFYNGEHGNTKPQWEADEAIIHANADAQWKKGAFTLP
ncbi:MAG: YHS domain-containing protein [Pegethrix bostrychoides GSE-TBD4-15B]|jgi:YHS domain-containing protein|uniref:YHS domain-containing protein n=1 Tax=Pegethrix bostrychoides GSE-TBD4-15B TaxID=2839662 RepID=A0A951PAP6_9CYAN|nr:YHS domain-containing protein [Pegethrix bostrychoides GSE-TBD4-15B]